MNAYKFLILGTLFFVSYDGASAMKLKGERWKRFENLFADRSDTKRMKCFEYLFNWRNPNTGNSLLHDVVQKNDIEFVAGFIGMGWPIDGKNAEGKTPLGLASEAKHVEVCKLLQANLNLLKFVRDDNFNGVLEALDVGADPNIRDMGGGTSLIEAAGQGLVKIVQLLISLGACVTSRNNNGFTPLLMAAYNGLEEIVRQLLVAQAYIDCVDSENRTPLWWAACNGNIGVVRQLLAAKADTTIRDTVFQYTALDIARKNERAAIIALLEDQPA